MPFMFDVYAPAKTATWTELGRRLGGELIRGGDWQELALRARVRGVQVTLDTFGTVDPHSMVVYTRLWASFDDPKGLQMAIFRKGLFSGLAKLLGMQDLVVGHEPFDRDFIIQGNDEGAVKGLFSDARVRELLQTQPAGQLSIGRGERKGTAELVFQVPGILEDVDQLLALFELFGRVFDGLGVAEPPPA